MEGAGEVAAAAFALAQKWHALHLQNCNQTDSGEEYQRGTKKTAFAYGGCEGGEPWGVGQRVDRDARSRAGQALGGRGVCDECGVRNRGLLV